MFALGFVAGLAGGVQCCGCLQHATGRDPGGRVVWTQKHGWRGLDDSEHRARRHQ